MSMRSQHLQPKPGRLAQSQALDCSLAFFSRQFVFGPQSSQRP